MSIEELRRVLQEAARRFVPPFDWYQRILARVLERRRNRWAIGLAVAATATVPVAIAVWVRRHRVPRGARAAV